MVFRKTVFGLWSLFFVFGALTYTRRPGRDETKAQSPKAEDQASSVKEVSRGLLAASRGGFAKGSAGCRHEELRGTHRETRVATPE